MDAPQNTAVNQALEHGFRLETLEIEPRAGRVSGPGGRETLDPKVMNVLMMMTRHAKQVVSRDELLARLWPNAVVTDDAVTRCFYVLRKQLSQAGGDLRYRSIIETLPKRGYRLNGEIAPLEPEPVEDAGESGLGRSVAIAAACSVALALYVIVALG